MDTSTEETRGRCLLRIFLPLRNPHVKHITLWLPHPVLILKYFGKPGNNERDQEIMRNL